jgi:hypothetical protein
VFKGGSFDLIIMDEIGIWTKFLESLMGAIPALRGAGKLVGFTSANTGECARYFDDEEM